MRIFFDQFWFGFSFCNNFLVFDEFWFKKIGTILSCDWSKTNRQKRSAWLYIYFLIFWVWFLIYLFRSHGAAIKKYTHTPSILWFSRRILMLVLEACWQR